MRCLPSPMSVGTFLFAVSAPNSSCERTGDVPEVRLELRRDPLT